MIGEIGARPRVLFGWLSNECNLAGPKRTRRRSDRFLSMELSRLSSAREVKEETAEFDDDRAEVVFCVIATQQIRAKYNTLVDLARESSGEIRVLFSYKFGYVPTELDRALMSRESLFPACFMSFAVAFSQFLALFGLSFHRAVTH